MWRPLRPRPVSTACTSRPWAHAVATSVLGSREGPLSAAVAGASAARHSPDFLWVLRREAVGHHFQAVLPMEPVRTQTCCHLSRRTAPGTEQILRAIRVNTSFCRRRVLAQQNLCIRWTFTDVCSPVSSDKIMCVNIF